MGAPINFVSVCTDAYPMTYAQKLHRQFAHVTSLEVAHWCITDRPRELPDFVTPIAPFKKTTGWWNKINLYHPQMPPGDILYMDLDIVILQNFDDEITAMTQCEEPMCCVSDAITWMGVRFSSSMMCFQSGAHGHIYENFLAVAGDITNQKGGDQVWTAPQLSAVHYIDDDFPNLKKNFKFHLARRNGTKFILPRELDKAIKLVDCGGNPKPHQLADLPYIKANWHDV